MKKALILIFVSVVYLTINAQTEQPKQMNESGNEGRASLSVGILNGGVV